jgi:hypothetical protein
MIMSNSLCRSTIAGRLLRYIEQEHVEEGPKTMEITQSTGKNLYDDDTGLIDSINPITVD